MAYSRREIAPRDQIKALRHARDRYAELADRIHNDIDSRVDAIERQTREEDARRIAKAYDRSLSNSLTQLTGMEKSHRTETYAFGGWHRIAVLIALTLSVTLPLAYYYAAPSVLNRFRAFTQIRNVTLKEAPSLAISHPIPSPVTKAQNAPPARTDFSDKLDAGTKTPAVASSASAPKKIVLPRERETKKAADNRPKKSLSQPVADKQVAAETPEVANPAIVSPSENLLPAQSANTPAPPLIEQPALPAVAIPIQPPATPRPEPIAGTHTLPGYPAFSARVGEAGTTKISVAISPLGQAVDCRISQSSGSDRLDRVACAHVTEYWRWKPLIRDDLATMPRTSVTIVWNLRKANLSR